MVKILPSNARGTGLIPGQRAKIPHASQPENQNIKQKEYCNKFNEDFKNGRHKKKSFKKMYNSLTIQWNFWKETIHDSNQWKTQSHLHPLHHLAAFMSLTEKIKEGRETHSLAYRAVLLRGNAYSSLL